MLARQRRFVEEYVKDGNGRQAAMRAGYAESNAAAQASKLLRRPDVRHYLAELQGKNAESLGISPETLIDRLNSYSEGGLSGVYPASTGVRATEMLARLSGMLVEKSEHVEVKQVVYRLELDRELGE